MSWFQLDAENIAERSRHQAPIVHVPSLGESISRGVVGLAIISVAGFAPWALAGLWFYRTIGEAGLDAVCALVFIGLSGPLLHRLIIGPGSLRRFYKLFSIAFGAYAVAWSAAWMSLGGRQGSLLGLLAGTALMGWILVSAFDARSLAWKAIAALFAFNSLGYFTGEWLERTLSATRTHPIVDKLVWGLCYGIGLGAGLGLAFHYCQREARRKLAGR
jgi:hypothetical protein